MSLKADKPVIVKIKPKLRASLTWSSNGSCYHSLSTSAASSKLAIFDLDGTLMTLNSTEAIKRVQAFALKCKEDGYQLVVISNQYGIVKGTTDHTQVQQRFQVLQQVLGTGVAYLYATDKDQYRKPMTGMYTLLLSHYGFERSTVHEDSFYCGDAVGRTGDFAVSDYYFAWNCGLRCLSAPDLKEVKVEAPKYQLYTNLEDLDHWLIDGARYLDMGSKTEPMLVMMVGPQGCGKSKLSQHLSQKGTFSVLNRDTIKSTSKMDSEFRRLSKTKGNIILDNTNYDHAKRAVYLDQAREQGYRVLIYHFDIPKELSFHMCHMRIQLDGPRIPPVAVHTYYKRLQPPTEEEGEIIHITGIPTYSDSPLDEVPEYYYHYNLKER